MSEDKNNTKPNLIDLNQFRNKKSRSWLKTHDQRIQNLIARHLTASVDVELHEIAYAYKVQQVANYEDSWDFWDLRDIISDVLYRSGMVERIYIDLKKENWFNDKMITEDKLLEMCVSRYILGI